MAQGMLTDYFEAKKRRNDLHPSKRQKLRDNCDITYDSTSELSFPAIIKKKEATATQQEIAKVGRDGRQRKRQQPAKSKFTVADIKENKADKAITLPTAESFNFSLKTVLPSDPDIVVTAYDRGESPQSSPIKHKNNVEEGSIQHKRKRYHNDSPRHGSTPKSCDVISPVMRSARKKLLIPENNSSDVQLSTVMPSTTSTEESLSEQVSPDSQPSKTAPSKMDLRTVLKGCGKLAELKACLQKVKDLSKEIKTSKVSDCMKNKEVNTPEKESETKSVSSTPAFEKYRDLAAKIPPTLTLPFKYKLLEDMFRGTDTVISIMHNRLERCTFDKLKRAVQDMIRKNFEPKHLGQIKAVYPESYSIRHEKDIIEAGIRSSNYQMTVEANIEDRDELVAKRKDGKPIFSSSEVVKRKETFKNKLFEIVKQHHQKYLESLTPPLKLESNKIVRWHPKFLLDEVPDIEPAELPSAPDEKREQFTAKDILEQATGRLPTKVENALKKVAEATEKAEQIRSTLAISKDVKSQSVTEPVNKSTSVPGISSTLLERIRAKEALKAQADMTRDEKSEQELDMLGRLPEMIKIIRSYFVTEKKQALTEGSIIVKLCDSYKSSISQSAVESHLAYLLKVMPDWISKVVVKSGTFIRVNRQTELTVLYDAINSLVKEKKYKQT